MTNYETSMRSHRCGDLRVDDAGKEEGMKTPDFDYFIPMIERVVENHAYSINP